MANDKGTPRQYPIRSDISQQGAAKAAAPPPAAYRIAGKVGDAASNAAMVATPLIAVPRALASGASALYNSPTVRSAIEGFAGLTPGALSAPEPVAVAAPAAPVASAASAAASALSQGRQAPLVVTPREQLDSYISQVLAHGATIGQVQRLGGLVEGTPKPTTHKDALIGTAGSIADATFAAARDAADKLPDAAAKDAARLKATDDYFKKYAALSGVNPQALSMQDLMDAQQGN